MISCGSRILHSESSVFAFAVSSALLPPALSPTRWSHYVVCCYHPWPSFGPFHWILGRFCASFAMGRSAGLKSRVRVPEVSSQSVSELKLIRMRKKTTKRKKHTTTRRIFFVDHFWRHRLRECGWPWCFGVGIPVKIPETVSVR